MRSRFLSHLVGAFFAANAMVGLLGHNHILADLSLALLFVSSAISLLFDLEKMP